MNKKLFLVLQIVLVLVALGGSLFVAFTPTSSLLNWYSIDDAFYYYKVAQNVLTGHGFTFDQINLSNGFHPLWMGVCLGVFWLSKINLMLPLRVLVVVSGLFNAATSLLLFRLLKRYIHPLAAFLGALVWGLSPSIYDSVTVHGMEAAISVFFIVLLISLAAKYNNTEVNHKTSNRMLVWLGVVGGFTILARLDNLFVVGAVGIFLLLKIKKIPTLLLFDILAISISVITAWIIRLGSAGLISNTYSVYPMLLLSALVIPIILFFTGCYQNVKSLSRRQIVLKVGIASALAFVIEYVLLFGLYKINILKMFSNSITFLAASISFILVMAVHLIFQKSFTIVSKNPFSTFGSWVKGNWKPIIWGGLSYGLPTMLIVGSYMLYNKVTFGTFSPVSGQIKHWWSTMDNTVYIHPNTILSVLGLSPSTSAGPWSLLTSKIYAMAEGINQGFSGIATDLAFGVLFLLLTVVFLVIMRAEKGRLAGKSFSLMIPVIFVGCILHITYYTSTGYSHTRDWYWVSEMLTLVLVGSLMLDGFFSWLDGLKTQIKLSPILSGILALLVVFLNSSYLYKLAPFDSPDGDQSGYLDSIKELEFYTKPDSKIGMTGGGWWLIL